MSIVKMHGPKERIVDLCIYVDKNLYNPNADKEKLFDSIYRIVYSLTLKQKVFQKWDEYESFALFATSRLFHRVQNPKQFLPDDHPKKMKKIKSILNFIKKTLYPMQVDYQKESFLQQFGPDYGGEAAQYIKKSITKSAQAQFNQSLTIDFKFYLSKISKSIKKFLTYSPYCEDKLLMHNIYISCLLTFLNQITLSNNNKKRMSNRLNSMYNIEDFINNIYVEEQQDSTILFHLPNTFNNYITTLVNESKIIILKDLRNLIDNSEPTEAIMQAIMQSVKETPNSTGNED